jgi:hypothetical protein
MSPRILLHPLAERHSRRRRPARRAVSAHRREDESTSVAQHQDEPASAAQPAAATQEQATTTEARDIDVERVRASGGPLDRASYSCQCGYLFAAPVTTTVSCPHCSAEQAW